MFSNLIRDFQFNLIEGARWEYLWRGLQITLIVTVCALVIGFLLGSVLGMVRASYDTIQPKRDTWPHRFLRIADRLTRIYLTVMRGTPVVVQLMIMYFVVFGASTNKMLAAILAFGLNSAAYVAEIIRGGILSVDPGQMEAGRSLGIGYITVMRRIVLPQAMKNVFPAMGNELITLMKETSVSGFIGLNDLTRGAEIIKGVTYAAFFPLLAAAAIYLVVVMLLTYILSRMERRMRISDRS